MVGLGNPGAKYQCNRHNIGAIFISQIAKDNQQNFSNNKNFFGEIAKVVINYHTVHLLKPSTFMNNSGQSVLALANFYKIQPEEILVCHDELDLPLATNKLKHAGGHGGHNGLRDIINRIASRDFYRLRLGIGRPPEKMAVADFVLQDFSKNQFSQVNDQMLDCHRVLDKVVANDMADAMQTLHTQE